MATATDELKVETEDIRPCVKKLSIEIAEPLVARRFDELLKSVRKNANVQGFRKGKAPREIVRKIYSESILWDIGQKLISETYEKAIKDNSLKVFGDPSIENVKVEGGKPISFTATIETLPDITVPDYSGWEFARKIEKVGKEAIEAPIAALLERFAELVPAGDRTVKDGDFVILDYVGRVAGEESDNEKLSGKNAELIVSTTDQNVLADFHAKLIGAEKDKENEFKITLPKQFPAPDLAGKEVSFRATVLGIKEKKLPELTDELVKENTPHKTVADMRAGTKKNLEEHAERMGDENLKSDILDRLIKETTFDLPPKMMEYFTQTHANQIQSRYAQAGMQMEQMPNFDKAVFEKDCASAGSRAAKEETILSAISEKEEIKPDTKELISLQKEYLKIIKDANPKIDEKESNSRAFSYAFKEVINSSVYKHLLSKIDIKDKIEAKAKENK